MPDEGYVIRKATAADTTVLSGATLPGVQFYTALGYVADEPLLDGPGSRADHSIRPHAQGDIALIYFIDFTCATN